MVPVRIEKWLTENKKTRMSRQTRLVFALAVQRFLHDADVVNVAFKKRCLGVFDKRRLLLKILDRAHSAVAHSRTSSTDKLKDHRRDGPLIRDAAFDTFRNQFARGFRVLTVAV